MSTIQDTRSVPAGLSLPEPSSHETHLTPAGQAVLTGATSLIVNGMTHPLCTMKNRKMAGQAKAATAKELYAGFLAINGVDTASFFTGFSTKDALEGKVGKFWASIAAALTSAPVIAVGEGLVVNRQVNGLPYSQSLLIALRVSGLLATVAKEIPFNLALFYLMPKLKEELDKIENQSVKEAIAGLLAGIADQEEVTPEMWAQTKEQIFEKLNEIDDDSVKEAIAGLLSGLVAGWVTTPVDFVKTNVQSSPQKTTIRKVVKENINTGAFKEYFKTPFRTRVLPLQQKANQFLYGKNRVMKPYPWQPRPVAFRQAFHQSGIPRFFKGAGARSLYVGGGTGIMSVLYSQLPKFLPETFKKNK